MLSEREVSAAIGSTAYGTDGDKLGTVEHFFVDDRTGVPTWVAVVTGLFGTRRSLVPAAEATFADGDLRLPVSKEAVRGAPHLGDSGHLAPAEEEELRRHYGLGGPAPAEPAPAPPMAAPPAPPMAAPPAAPMATAPLHSPAPAGTPPAQASVPDDGAMIRSEERLAVGTEQVPTTRVRLVKYVVTEEVQLTVPIRREEIRVEEVPIGAPDPTTDPVPGESLVPGTTGGLPDEIVLHTERPVVTVEVVPTERVRLRTEIVAGQETVSGRVQREQITVDEDPIRRPAP